MYTLLFNKNNKNSISSFVAIRAGIKKIETRSPGVRYRNIKEGDKLEFRCGGEKFLKKIKKVQKFNTIDEMLKVYKVKDIMPNLSTKAEIEEVYYSYPNYKEKIKKYGLIAMELE